MSKIIDLDFYRKFRVVLSSGANASLKSTAQKASKNEARPLRRRRKIDPTTQSRTKK